ncbi:hypothetical protein PCANB_000364 [Pneumocystis canis]|nr:hypothetical protein PCANB_000364 [Pneumocystis canis]
MKLSELNKISLRQTFSGVFGAISLASWIITVYPQLIKNYRQKSGESISLRFLFLWLTGDIFALIGSIWGELILIVIITQVYFFFSDTLLILQVLYYRRRPNLKSKAIRSDFKEMSPLNVFLAFLIVVVFGVLGWIITISVGGIKKPNTDTSNPVGFLIFGYIGSFLYLFARVPQIIKNFRSKSTEGLSFLFFAFTLFGNITYSISILLIDTSRNYILMNLPWLLGSLGTLAMDLLVG